MGCSLECNYIFFTVKCPIFQWKRCNIYESNTIFSEIEGRVKFLSTDIIKDDIFIDQFIEFFFVGNVEILQSMAKYKGCNQAKIDYLVKQYRRKLVNITKK